MPKLVNEATLSDIKTENPGVYTAIIEEGKKQALQEVDVDAKCAQAREEGAKSENERLKAIDAINVPGSENIVAENKFNREMTADSIASLILKNQEAVRKAESDKVRKDAENLGADISDLGASQLDPSANGGKDKVLVTAMTQGLNRNRNR